MDYVFLILVAIVLLTSHANGSGQNHHTGEFSFILIPCLYSLPQTTRITIRP